MVEYRAYVKLDNNENTNIYWSACWCHGRRYFEEVKALDLALRDNILKKIRYLFMFERIAWLSNSEKRLEIRQKHEKPIVDQIFKALKVKVTDSTLLPKSKLATAIGYMLNYERNFRLYLSDPNIRMENNTAERALRKVVIGRKNWLFFGSRRGGEAAAVMYSLVQTCRVMQINPLEYLTDIFKRLMAHPSNKLHELLPDQWAKVNGKNN